MDANSNYFRNLSFVFICVLLIRIALPCRLRLRRPLPSGRIKDIVQRAGVRPLDEAQRARTKRKQLEALERDNHDDQFDANTETAVAQEEDEEGIIHTHIRSLTRCI